MPGFVKEMYTEREKSLCTNKNIEQALMNEHSYLKFNCTRFIPVPTRRSLVKPKTFSLLKRYRESLFKLNIIVYCIFQIIYFTS